MAATGNEDNQMIRKATARQRLWDSIEQWARIMWDTDLEDQEIEACIQAVASKIHEANVVRQER